MKLLILV